MSATQGSALERALWPADGGAVSVWGVFDGARGEALWRALHDSRLEVLGLLGSPAAPVPRELDVHGPQLVELLPGHRLVAGWASQGWGRSWGVALRSRDPANLRLHLRRFLRVQDGLGRRLLFRFYDPRVLPAFLRTCDAQQLQTLFADNVQAWLCEVAAGRFLAEFTLHQGRLHERRIPVAVA